MTIKKTKATATDTAPTTDIVLATGFADFIAVSSIALTAIKAHADTESTRDTAALAWKDTVTSEFGDYGFTKSPQGNPLAVKAHRPAYASIIQATFTAAQDAATWDWINNSKVGAGAERMYNGSTRTKKYIQQQKGQPLKALMNAVEKAEKNIKSGKGANSRNRKDNIVSIADRLQGVYNMVAILPLAKLDKTTTAKMRNDITKTLKELNDRHPDLKLKIGK